MKARNTFQFHPWKILFLKTVLNSNVKYDFWGFFMVISAALIKYKMTRELSSTPKDRQEKYVLFFFAQLIVKYLPIKALQNILNSRILPKIILIYFLVWVFYCFMVIKGKQRTISPLVLDEFWYRKWFVYSVPVFPV